MALGAFSFVISFAEDWLGDLNKLNEMVKMEQSKTDIIEQVTELARSHSIIKELSWLV